MSCLKLLTVFGASSSNSSKTMSPSLVFIVAVDTVGPPPWWSGGERCSGRVLPEDLQLRDAHAGAIRRRLRDPQQQRLVLARAGAEDDMRLAVGADVALVGDVGPAGVGDRRRRRRLVGRVDLDREARGRRRDVDRLDAALLAQIRGEADADGRRTGRNVRVPRRGAVA